MEDDSKVKKKKKRNRLLIYSATWMNLSHGAKAPKCKRLYCLIPFM